MTRTEKIAFTIILAVSIAAYGMSRLVSSDAFGSHWIAREDGVLEWLTVLSLGGLRDSLLVSLMASSKTCNPDFPDLHGHLRVHTFLWDGGRNQLGATNL